MIEIASFGWPQWLVLVWYAFAIVATAAQHQKLITVNSPFAITVTLIILLSLTAGGFFHG